MEEVKIIRALQRLGVPNHTKGYKNLAVAVQIVLENENISIRKGILEETSRRCKDTCMRVERNMRYSVELADVEQREFYQLLFGYDKKPPLTGFIITVANYIKHPELYN